MRAATRFCLQSVGGMRRNTPTHADFYPRQLVSANPQFARSTCWTTRNDHRRAYQRKWDHRTYGSPFVHRKQGAGQSRLGRSQAAAPFRPLPAELQKEKTLKLRFHFNYNLPQADERPVCGPPPPGTLRVNSEVTAPRMQSSPDAEFSESARRDKYQGEAELRLTVAEDGQVRDVCVSQSLGEGLDEKSVAAIRNWKFEPGRKEGKPVPVWISVTTNFHLY